jgi:hypothetical protein
MGPSSLATVATSGPMASGSATLSLDGDGFAAGSLDFGDDLFRLCLGAGVVDGDGGAAGG